MRSILLLYTALNRDILHKLLLCSVDLKLQIKPVYHVFVHSSQRKIYLKRGLPFFDLAPTTPAPSLDSFHRHTVHKHLNLSYLILFTKGDEKVRERGKESALIFVGEWGWGAKKNDS
jgi:hypothetical protein